MEEVEMLVLGRKGGQCILIGRGTEVTVLEVRKNRVKFSIDAIFLPVARDECPQAGKLGTGILVISRKIGQGFSIAGMVHISVERIRGKSVRIGIVAPEDLRIRRGEQFEGAIVAV